ncbi:MAG TPA: VWA domain-containing protein [Pyrinomonadaceae bacterium]|nr:VWA domain-containing protein [Pyrinomonadaceae bacterium]
MKKFFPSLVILIFSCILSFAQTPTPTPKPVTNDEEVVKISTTLIQVDVTVTDRKGKIVTNLKPEDFEIFENNEKQTITNFSFISSVPEATPAPTPKPNKNDMTAPIPPTQLRPEQVRRTIALVVDDLGLSFESVYYVRRGLKKFVDEQMQPNDFVAIIRTGSGVGALQQFTSDKNLLYAAIEKIRWNPLGRGGVSAFAPIEPTPLEDAQAAGADVSDEDIQADKDKTTLFNEFREDIFSVGTLGAINFVVKGMDELPGRKSIMLFSDGFSICTETDIKEDPERCTRMRDSIRQLTDLCNRASVTIYTQDARGLQYTGLTAADSVGGNPQAIQSAMSSRSAELLDKQEGLATLARDTGGKAIFNNNDLNKGLEKLLEDTKGYYLLGYQPDSDTFDAKTRKYNKLTVKVKNKDLSVSYRSGFFGVADADRRPVAANTTLTPAQQILKAISSPFSANGINLKLNTLFGRDDKSNLFVNSLLHVDAKDLKFTDSADGAKKAVFDVLAISFGENGVVTDQISKTYTLTAKNQEGYEQLIRDGFVYQFLFPVKKPGAYQMRVAIRDTVNSIVGSANQFIEVPDLKKGRLTLSGIVLENMTEKQWGEMQNASPDTPRTRGTDPMADTSLRQFKRGTVLRYATEIYNAKLGQTKQPNLQTQIRVFKDGKLIKDGKPTPFNLTGQTNPTKLSVLGALSLGAQMEPGDYVLQIVVIDNLAKTKNKLATQWVQFEITE